MTKAAHDILAQALQLEYGDRAEIARRMGETLWPRTDPDYIAEWEAELLRRSEPVARDQVEVIPLDPSPPAPGG